MIRSLLVLCFTFIGINMSANPVVVMETTQGSIHIKLFPEAAPKACENFLSLVDKGYYKGTLFHRVILDFMIQGGDPTGTGARGESIWKEPFEDEITDTLSFNKPYLLAMANKGPNTNGSQFFITTAQTPWLDKRHTIFGEVIKGYDTVKKINRIKTDSMDRPLQTQKIVNIHKLQN